MWLVGFVLIVQGCGLLGFALSNEMMPRTNIGSSQAELARGPRLIGLVGNVITEGSFGPHGCISVSRSVNTGSCVLRTKCTPDEDLSSVEFAFLCSEHGSRSLHSFGIGGFGANETFDTGIRCDACSARSAPAPLGPGGCASVFKSPAGTCVVQTSLCAPKDISHQSLSFLCADADGRGEEHTLKRGALNSMGALDTGVACTRCLGPRHGVPAPEMNYGTQALATFENDIRAVRAEVTALRQQIAAIRATAPNGNSSNGTLLQRQRFERQHPNLAGLLRGIVASKP